MKDFVEITSMKDITVTPGLQGHDFSNPDAHVPDRLRVGSTWPKSTVQVKKGFGVYPAEILEWNTVKKMIELKIFVVGQRVDEPTEKAKEDKETIEKAKTEIEDTFVKTKAEEKKSRKKKTLDELTEE